MMKTATQQEIQTPRLPKQLSRPLLPILEDLGEFVAANISDVTWERWSALSATFEQSYLRNINLTQARLPKLRLVDVQLEACDLTATGLEQARLQRVLFNGCRMMGAQLLDARCEDVIFRECLLEGAVFAGTTFKAARFEHCDLREAVFTETDLSRVVFQRCNLTRVDVRGGKLVGADLRGSLLNGMQAGVKELRGAIIDPTQAVQVVSVLGLRVKDVDE